MQLRILVYQAIPPYISARKNRCETKHQWFIRIPKVKLAKPLAIKTALYLGLELAKQQLPSLRTQGGYFSYIGCDLLHKKTDIEVLASSWQRFDTSGQLWGEVYLDPIA